MAATGYGLDDKVSLSGDTMSGTLTLEGAPPLNIPARAAPGYVATSDADGNVSWQPVTEAELPAPVTVLTRIFAA